MKIKIEHKVLHREWDEATLTPEQFVLFDKLVDKGEVYLSPTFVFDNGNVYADEGWDLDDDKVSTSSSENGIVSYLCESEEYVEFYYQREKKLGKLVSVNFTVDEEVRAVFKLMEAGYE